MYDTDVPALSAWRDHAALGAVLLLAGVLMFSGMRITLPYTPEADEWSVAEPAASVAGGDLNPHWFGHPSSTLIYPLAFVLKAGGLETATNWPQTSYSSDWAPRYIAARVLTGLYALAALLFVYLAAKALFGRRVALLGTLLAAAHPVAVQHAQIARSDAPATFFGAVFVWLVVREGGLATPRRQALAGAILGLAVSSRYFMVVLAVLYLAVVVTSRPRSARAWGKAFAIGGGASILVFALSTPFFFLDFGTAWSDLQVEARSVHPGADGLGRTGNFAWYLLTAGPASVGWPQWAAAALGLGWCLARPSGRRAIFALLPLVFILATSTSPLHWQRWLIPILPWVAVLGAFAAISLATLIGRGRSRGVVAGALAALVVALMAWPLGQTALSDVRRARVSTRVIAREWVIANLPRGTRITTEWYGPPLEGALGYTVAGTFSIGRPGAAKYFADGADYVVVSSDVYDRFFREPDRYPAEITAYASLFRSDNLAASFEGSEFRGGPDIRIYRRPD